MQALRGANYFSSEDKQLIQLRIRLEKTDSLSDADWAWINENILRKNSIGKNVIPEVFLSIVKRLLHDADMPVSYERILETKDPDTFVILFSYQFETCGKKAAEQAFQLFNERRFSQEAFINEVQILRELKESSSLPQPVDSFVSAMKSRQIPCYILPGDIIQVGNGAKQIRFAFRELMAGKAIEQFKDAEMNIPIVAVTGSNGKTTTTRLIAHILSAHGVTVGFTTSDGIYVGSKMIDQGDTTGPISALEVLTHPKVTAVVLETARGGILRAGLGFDRCDISVVTNIQDDHLGISDIHTLDDLSRVKEVIVKATRPDGYAVLNAENAYTLGMGQRANCKVALFSLDPECLEFSKHVLHGLPGASVKNGTLCIWDKGEVFEIETLDRIPLTFNGSLLFMVQNALAASLAAFLQGVSKDNIALALRTFYPSAEQTPGRMNLFEIKGVHILVDFAHNPDGFRGIRDYLKTVAHKPKTGLIVGTGDRRDEDIIELGKLSAEMFDEVLIHQKKFLRGRTRDEIIALLEKGIDAVNAALPKIHVPDNIEPLGFALERAIPGSMIIALSDVLDDPIALIAGYKASMEG